MVVAVTCGASGCGSGSDISGLDGTVGAKDVAGMPVRVDEPTEFSAYLKNDSGHAVTLVSARMLARQGFTAPPTFRLAVVQRGLQGVAVSPGWPIKGFEYSALKGYQLRSGQQIAIVYSVSSDRLGVYVANGVAVTVESSGYRRTTVDVIGPGEMCVMLPHARNCPPGAEAKLENSVYR